MMLILMRLKTMMLLPMGIIPPSCGIFISIVVRMMIRTEMIPIMRSSFRRFLESGESSFSILLFYLNKRNGSKETISRVLYPSPASACPAPARFRVCRQGGIGMMVIYLGS